MFASLRGNLKYIIVIQIWKKYYRVMCLRINMKINNSLNCWQFKKCGREPGGRNVEQSGVCSVAVEIGADGIHSGKNGGRCCWVITNSVCESSTHGFCLKKIRGCRKCDFYFLVEKAEKLLFAA